MLPYKAAYEAMPQPEVNKNTFTKPINCLIFTDYRDTEEMTHAVLEHTKSFIHTAI